MGGERKPRHALIDIGNMVTFRGVDGKSLPQVSRPVTRSFCAKLLGNAEAKKNKNLLGANANGPIVVVDGARPEKKAVARKPVQKNAVVIEISPDTEEAVEKEKVGKKSTLTDVIEISPDTDEAVKKEKVGKNSRKKAPTLASTLTARSKAACGLSNKPKVQIVDIDAADANNDLYVVEYVEEIYKYYKSAENEGRTHDYIDSQPDLNVEKRAILIDWLVEVHYKFKLPPETLYLTVNVIDRYLALKTAPRKELQLVGLSAMLIASKYEDVWAPKVNDLVCILDRTYSVKQVLVMEKQILGALEWNLAVPTLYVFLVRFIKASMTATDVENMVYFLAELGLMNYSSTIMFSPSMIAASAVYAARCTVNQAPFWNETLKLHTGFSEAQLMDCAKVLVSFHSSAGDNLSAIYRKYSIPQRGGVALLPPAQSLTTYY